MVPFANPPSNVSLRLLHGVEFSIPGHRCEIIAMLLNEPRDPFVLSFALVSGLPVLSRVVLVVGLPLKLLYDCWICIALQLARVAILTVVRKIVQRVVQWIRPPMPLSREFNHVIVFNHSKNLASFGVPLHPGFSKTPLRSRRSTAVDVKTIRRLLRISVSPFFATPRWCIETMD